MEQDYPVIRTWWERRGSPAPSPVILPDVGVIVENHGDLVACAFLYTDSAGRVAMAEWEATNPDNVSAMAAIRGLNLIFDFLEKFAKSQGFQIVLSWVASERGDGRILERRNWTKCPGERHELMAYQVT